jgi:NADPH:quinone reductase-like Zn-dependent oxidoreductase
VSVRSTGWFLYAAGPKELGRRGELIREDFDVGDVGPDQVLAESLYGSFEGNMGHAIDRRPIDICRQRGEPKVVIGNAGVVRVLEVGSDVKDLRPGQACVLFGSSVVDGYGYPEKMLGYDAPGTMGVFATRIKVRSRELIPVPEQTRHSLAQWAAFSVRYITAWSNWELAYGTLRLLLPEQELPQPHVWGWGGGTTFAELDLARRNGCRAVMVSGEPRRLKQIEDAGITALDKRTFGSLTYDEKRFAQEPEYRRVYAAAEQAFVREVHRLTDGEKVHVFVDYIGEPVFRATSKVLARQGVLTTAGWKEGMTITYLRASECIGRHQFVHTHYARRAQADAAVQYGEKHGWMPPVDDPVSFDEIPALAGRFSAGDVGLFPVFTVCPE